MSELKNITTKDYTEDGMDVLEFAKNFMERTNHPGFKLVVADCIDEITQLRGMLDRTRDFLETADRETCMCGGSISNCSDHHPVSIYDRYVEEILDDIRDLLTGGRG